MGIPGGIASYELVTDSEDPLHENVAASPFFRRRDVPAADQARRAEGHRPAWFCHAVERQRFRSEREP
jgi:hypothetical protein